MPEQKKASLSIIDFDKYTVAANVGIRRIMTTHYLLKAYRGRRFFAEDWRRQPGNGMPVALNKVVEIPLDKVKKVFPEGGNVRQIFKAWRNEKLILLLEK
jgi:hypothetical protein